MLKEKSIMFWLRAGDVINRACEKIKPWTNAVENAKELGSTTLLTLFYTSFGAITMGSAGHDPFDIGLDGVVANVANASGTTYVCRSLAEDERKARGDDDARDLSRRTLVRSLAVATIATGVRMKGADELPKYAAFFAESVGRYILGFGFPLVANLFYHSFGTDDDRGMDKDIPDPILPNRLDGFFGDGSPSKPEKSIYNN